MPFCLALDPAGGRGHARHPHPDRDAPRPQQRSELPGLPDAPVDRHADSLQNEDAGEREGGPGREAAAVERERGGSLGYRRHAEACARRQSAQCGPVVPALPYSPSLSFLSPFLTPPFPLPPLLHLLYPLFFFLFSFFFLSLLFFSFFFFFFFF